MQFCTHRDDRWGRADRRASRVVALMRSIIPIGTMEASEAASAGSVIRLDLSRTSTACGLTITRSTWRLIRPRSAAAPGSSVVSMCLRTPSRERRLRPRPTQQRSVGSGNPVLSESSCCWFSARPSIKRRTRTPTRMVRRSVWVKQPCSNMPSSVAHNVCRLDDRSPPPGLSLLNASFRQPSSFDLIALMLGLHR